MGESQGSVSFLFDPDARQSNLGFSGDWLLDRNLPDFSSAADFLHQNNTRSVVIDTQQLGRWDSTFVSFLLQLHRFCIRHKLPLETDALPVGAKKLLTLATTVDAIESSSAVPGPWLERIGSLQLLKDAWKWLYEISEFIGLVTLAMLQLFKGQAKTRLSDVVYFVDQAGPKAIPIISLTSVLVGMILAYLGAMQLQTFGAQIYVANLVSMGMVREMGALMTAVVMAGRTGAAYAAQLGTMQTNEEIDAVITLGISPVELLVLPRMISLVLIMPLLCLYSDVLGILGGSLVAISMDISATQFIGQLQGSIDLVDVLTGLFKATVFAVLIAIAGCQAGLQCGRSSAAVGEATTRAVVAAIVYLIIADASLNILFQKLGI